MQQTFFVDFDLVGQVKGYLVLSKSWPENPWTAKALMRRIPLVLYTVWCLTLKTISHPNLPVFFINVLSQAAASFRAPGIFTPTKIIIALFCVIFHAAISKGVLKVHSSVMSDFMSHVKDHHIDSARVSAGCQVRSMLPSIFNHLPLEKVLFNSHSGGNSLQMKWVKLLQFGF